ncbi:hypothetical protein Tco_1486341 [Tanacetum coccineum]
MSRQLVEMNNNVLKLQENILEKETKISELEECMRNKDLEIEKCLERLNDCENKLHKIRQTHQTIPMIMPSKDKLYNGRKGIEKILIDLEYEVVSLLEKEKENLEIIESLKSKGFESSENAISESENQSKNNCQQDEKGYDSLENSKVIAPGMFKINMSQSLSPILVSKTSCASNNVENKTKRKRHLDTLSSVRRPKHSSVIWKKKGILLVLICLLLYASYDVNDLCVSDDVGIRNSRVSKMPFRKKPCDSLNVCSKSNSNNSLPKTLFRWLPKMQPLAEPIVQICLWIIDSGCSKHMMGNRALLTNFVEKFLGMVRFGNNDFVVIAGYGDVVIGSMTIKNVYYVKGLGYNLFSGG